MSYSMKKMKKVIALFIILFAVIGVMVLPAHAATSSKLATPAAPKLSNTSSGVKVSWSAVSGAEKYVIYRKLSGGEYTAVCVTTSTSWTDKSAVHGTRYGYRIACCTSASTKSNLTLTSSKGTSSMIVRMTTPSLSSLASNSAGSITVKWAKVGSVSGYQIQYSTSSAFSSGNKTTKVSGASFTSKIIKSLTKGKKYYVRIRTYKTYTIDGTSYTSYSAWSGKKNVTVSSTSISTNWSSSTTKKQSSDSSYYVLVNGTKFYASKTFYTYTKSGSTYTKTTGGSGYYVKNGSSYVYVAAAQCLGFAHNVEYLLHGKYDGTDSQINSGFSTVSGASGLTLNSSTSTSKLKSYITTAGAGAHIRLNTSSGKHSIVVISVNDNGFYYCDANGTSGNNIISVGYFTWSGFAKSSSYSSIKYIRYYTG